jgi:hypothetical protein
MCTDSINRAYSVSDGKPSGFGMGEDSDQLHILKDDLGVVCRRQENKKRDLGTRLGLGDIGVLKQLISGVMSGGFRNIFEVLLLGSADLMQTLARASE